MINVQNIKIELEDSLRKRVKEMLFLESQLKNISDENDKDVYRKSLVVMLYSHFEGFFKQAFDDFYVDIINNESVNISEANYAIQACSLLTVFKDLQNITNKSDIFKNSLPDDTELHTFHRRLEFVKNIDTVFGINSSTSTNKIAKIPITNQNKRLDKGIKGLVDTESNLKPATIKKILFQLGFPHEIFKEYDTDIKDLLYKRNEIGHGTFTKGINKNTYIKLRKSVCYICIGVIKLVVAALQNKEYLREEYRTI